MAKIYREYECSCGHKWTSAVQLSSTTSNLSGEATAFCPECERRAAYASSYTDPNDIELQRLVEKHGKSLEAMGLTISKESKMKEIPFGKIIYAVEFCINVGESWAVEVLFMDKQDALDEAVRQRQINRGMHWRVVAHEVRAKAPRSEQ